MTVQDVLTKCSSSIQSRLEKFFGAVGRIVGNNPWRTIVISIIISCLFGIGLSQLKTESRVAKLWVPQNVVAIGQSEWVSTVFGDESRTIEIIIDPDRSNVLTAHYVKQFWYAHYLLVNTSVRAPSDFRSDFPDTYSWDGYDGSEAICLFRGEDCTSSTILDITGSSYEDVFDLTDSKLLDLVNNYTDTEELETIIGGLEYDNDGMITRGAVLRGVYTTESAQIQVGKQEEDPTREEWELTVTDKLLDYSFSGCNVYPYSSAAFNEEFSSAVAGDASAYSIGFTLLIVYTAIAMGKRDYVHSMVALALCSILTVILAVVSSYGLAAAVGVMYTSLSGSLPFLVLGLGVDDAFIIVGEFHQQSKLHRSLPAEERLEKAMRHAGVSILVTSVTDFLAFAIGYSTVLPALQAFCFYAALGVLAVFLLNCTFFAACVVIDSRRADDNRLDYCCCCIKLQRTHYMFPSIELNTAGEGATSGEDSEPQKQVDKPDTETDTNNAEEVEKHEEETENTGERSGDENTQRDPCCGCCHLVPEELSRDLFRRYARFLLNWKVRITVMVLAFGFLVFGIYGATQLRQDFDLVWFLPDTSYLQDFLGLKEKYFEVGTSLFIFCRDFQYDSAGQEKLAEASALINDADYVTGSTFDWYSNFQDYVGSNATLSESEFYQQLDFWLSTSGGQYSGSVVWNNANDTSLGIKGSFILGEYSQRSVRNADAQVQAMRDSRGDVADITNDQKEMFAFTFEMLFWEQYAVIARELWQNLALSMVVVIFIAFLLIPNPKVAMLVIICVVASIVDLLGAMWLWGLTIDAVTVCYTVIAIGLAVDYSAHIGEAFVVSKKTTVEDRVVDSLFHIGPSVFNAAFSTFLAVVAMAGSQTYVFRVFFQQFFLLTLLGCAHGLVVLPVLLSIFGPEKAMSHTDDHHDTADETQGTETELQVQNK